MDAVDFLKTYRRICSSNDCADCPLWMDECMIIHKERFSESKVISTVEQWAKEHPVKTRQSEFFEDVSECETGRQWNFDNSAMRSR